MIQIITANEGSCFGVASLVVEVQLRASPFANFEIFGMHQREIVFRTGDEQACVTLENLTFVLLRLCS